MIKEPVLVAFPLTESEDGTYNVWRYDCKPTACVCFNIKATSQEHALEQARNQIKLKENML